MYQPESSWSIPVNLAISSAISSPERIRNIILAVQKTRTKAPGRTKRKRLPKSPTRSSQPGAMLPPGRDRRVLRLEGGMDATMHQLWMIEQERQFLLRIQSWNFAEVYSTPNWVAHPRRAEASTFHRFADLDGALQMRIWFRAIAFSATHVHVRIRSRRPGDHPDLGQWIIQPTSGPPPLTQACRASRGLYLLRSRMEALTLRGDGNGCGALLNPSHHDAVLQSRYRPATDRLTLSNPKSPDDLPHLLWALSRDTLPQIRFLEVPFSFWFLGEKTQFCFTLARFSGLRALWIRIEPVYSDFPAAVLNASCVQLSEQLARTWRSCGRRCQSPRIIRTPLLWEAKQRCLCVYPKP
jgi:hypothetical protein